MSVRNRQVYELRWTNGQFIMKLSEASTQVTYSVIMPNTMDRRRFLEERLSRVLNIR